MNTKFLFCSLILFSFIGIGCNESEESDKIDKIEDDSNLWFEYQLLTINERNIKRSKSNQLRLIIQNTYGFPSYFLGVVELDNSFLIYEKTQYLDEDYSFESRGRNEKAIEFEDSWNELINLELALEPNDMSDNLSVGHDPSWLLELKTDSMYSIKEGSMTDNNIAIIKSIYGYTSVDLPKYPATLSGN